MTKATHNGTCQACGRVQAIRANGLLAKHGYTTEYGFFNGTCSGSDHPPLELQTGHNEQVVINLREWAGAHEATAAGEVLKVPVTKRQTIHGKRVDVVGWLDQEAYEADRSILGHWDHAVESYRWNLRRKAEQARASADALEALRARVHGQPVQPRSAEPELVRETYRSYRQACTRVAELAAQGIDARQRRSSGWNRDYVVTYRK